MIFILKCVGYIFILNNLKSDEKSNTIYTQFYQLLIKKIRLQIHSLNIRFDLSEHSV